MNRHEFTIRAEQCLQELLRDLLPPHTPVHLFGSRARKQNRWNSDFDLWIEADIDLMTKSRLEDAIEESIVPFRVDIVTTKQLKGEFGDLVRRDAIRWI